MPKGPHGEKRPADVIGAAIKVARIATGEEPEAFPPDDGKDKAAQALGRKGGKALWSMEDIVALVDARAPKPGRRGPYKKRMAGMAGND